MKGPVLVHSGIRSQPAWWALREVSPDSAQALSIVGGWIKSQASVVLRGYAFPGVVVCSSCVQSGVASASHLWP